MSSVYDITKQISFIISKLSTLDNLEIEAKIRKIDESDFELLRDLLTSRFEKIDSYSIDYYIKEKRITEQDGKYIDTSKKKQFEQFLTIGSKSIKFNVAEEESKVVTKKDIKDFDFKREKERISFVDGNVRIDLTKVTRNKEVNYEFELEVVDPKRYNEREFGDKITFYFNVVNNYLESTVSFCNEMLSNGKIKDKDEIKYGLVSRPRDLLKTDITKPNSILKGFTASIKADGVQYFLIIYKYGVWLMNQKGEKMRVGPLDDKFRELKGSIFAGEYIVREKLKEGTKFEFLAFFLPFDTISYKGKSVVDNNYLDRVSYFSDIKGTEIVSKGVNILKIGDKKIFDLGEDSDSFYKGFRECYLEKKNIIYQEDGYILTPKYSPYVANGQNRPKRERTLARFLDVCKWKPVEKRSMDFLVMGGKIHTYERKRNQVFQGLTYSLDFPESLEGKIVEFFPVFEDESISLKPERIRDDKTFPNKTETVLEIVKSYTEFNPITEKTLLGKDTNLMREFNNNFIKSKLINDLEGYIVDIGAGKGGDLAKFGYNSKIRKVLSVEPNKEFSTEFKRRLSLSKFKNKFYLLEETKGEDTETIIQGMRDAFPEDFGDQKMTITFMISMSFFWSTEENLAKLANTIIQIDKEYKIRGGKMRTEIVFYTIDGYKVEDLFKKIGKDSIKLNTITLKQGGDGQVFIDIQDSKTVSQQTEYLVKLDKLNQMTGLKQVYIREPRAVNILMSKPERVYLSLFVYGKSVLNKSVRLTQKLQKQYVNEKEGIEYEGKIIAKGDDDIEKVYYLKDNIYRISTIDMNESLYHSLLKLMDENYRDTDFEKRIEAVEQIKKKIKTIEDAGKYFNIGIKIYTGKESKIYNPESEEFIMLMSFGDNKFEPLIYLDAEVVSYTFDKDSYLI
tara:strand:+ start:9140 stop:11848 length:2709 start_codon:yes stop_codon:yes gene_type:complete